MISKNSAIELKKVKVEDSFWKARIALMAEKVIKYQWDALNDQIPGAEPSHAVENFRIAAGESKKDFYGMVFQDSDVAKWIEAASYCLLHYPDKDLERILDELIGLIGRAQQPDGYLNTYFTVGKPGQRWTDFSFGHELYCAGHMIEAGVAHYYATGKKELLDIVCRYADYIDTVMGPEENKMHVYCGHEEIELALMKLYKATGEARYLNLAGYFIDERGKQPSFLASEPTFGHDLNQSKWSKLDYHQAHQPVREQTEVVGHAVRAVYLYTAMADLALETGDEHLETALHALWNSTVRRKMYITGGIGSQGHAERFTFNYDLPNDSSYTETCAAIGLVFWAHRMLLLDTDSRYADVAERALYNGILSGISLDGMKYFYVNPLEVHPEAVENRHDLQHVKPERVQWFGCACCPPNIARLVASIGQYIYTTKGRRINVHQYIGSRTEIELEGGSVTALMQSGFPWNGEVSVQVSLQQEMEFEFAFRIPDWCGQYSITINGKDMGSVTTLNKGYAVIKRVWQDGDKVELIFPMLVLRISANPRVRDDVGKVCLQRGPVVYCLEEADNGSNLQEMILPRDTAVQVQLQKDLLEGVSTLLCDAERESHEEWGDVLYRADCETSRKQVKAKFVPYYAWANRKPGEMAVWVREK